MTSPNYLQPDLALAQRHLTLLDEGAESFVFQTFDDDKKRKDPALIAVLHGTLDQHQRQLLNLSKRGAGVFVTVNYSCNGGRKKDDIGGYRAIFREADEPGLPQLPLEPHFVIESSPGKQHEYLLIDRSEDHDTWAAIMATMVNGYGSDPNAADRSRVLRLAGFPHQKDPANPHMVTIVHESGAQPYSMAEVAKHIPPTVKAKKKPAAIVNGASTSYGQKALEYEIAELTATPEGSRNAQLNKAAFSAGQLVAGGELDLEAAKSALLAAAVSIGLPESEAMQTIRSGGEAGSKEPRKAPAVQTAPVEWEPTSPEWPVMDSRAYHGIAADFIDLATRSSEADPAAIMGTFITRFGVECGPGPFLQVGDSRHRARLATVIVGASSKARKGTSGKPVAELFKFAGLEDQKPLNTARASKGPFSSGEGIIFAIRDSVKKWNVKDQVEEIVDPGVEDKRLFVLDEEFGGVLANTKREGNTLSMIIRQAWDSGDFDPLTKNNKTTATGGHVGWVSHITLQELHSKLDESEGFNGFANRILWACAKRQKLVPLPEPMPQNELAKIQQHLVDILRGIGQGAEIRLGAQAKEAWRDQYYAELTKDRPGLCGCVTNRGEAQALRLAMNYCLLDGETVISLAHLEAGLAFWDYCRQSANYIFHGRQTDTTAQTILEAVKKGPMTGKDIHGLFGNNANKMKLETALSGLIASNRVVLEKRSNHKGAPTKVYKFHEAPYELNEINELNTPAIDLDPIKFVNSFNSLGDAPELEVFEI